MGWLQPVGKSTGPRPRQRSRWKFTMSESTQVPENKTRELKRSRDRIDVLAKVLARTASSTVGKTTSVQGDAK